MAHVLKIEESDDGARDLGHPLLHTGGLGQGGEGGRGLDHVEDALVILPAPFLALREPMYKMIIEDRSAYHRRVSKMVLNRELRELISWH